MFGLTNFFAALRRLTESVNNVANTFEELNGNLKIRFGIDPSVDTIEPSTIPTVNGHGNRRLRAARSQGE